MRKPLRACLRILPIVLFAASCAAKPTPPASSLDLVPFQEMARTAQCADLVNTMFLIDDALVFWHIEGNCADGSYSYMLFGGNTDELLCRYNDSIAGPMKECFVLGYEELFDTLLEHSEETDLGLGSGHAVLPIPF